MDISAVIKQIGSMTDQGLDTDALLKIKSLIWTDDLESIALAIDAEIKLETSHQEEMRRLQIQKKKCYQALLDIASQVQAGRKDAEKKLEDKKSELESISEAIDETTFLLEQVPKTLRTLKESLINGILEAVYFSLKNAERDRIQVVDEIEKLRALVKEKWTLKFELDERIKSMNAYIGSLLNKDQIDALDQHFLDGGSS